LVVRPCRWEEGKKQYRYVTKERGKVVSFLGGRGGPWGKAKKFRNLREN